MFFPNVLNVAFTALILCELYINCAETHLLSESSESSGNGALRVASILLESYPNFRTRFGQVAKLVKLLYSRYAAPPSARAVRSSRPGLEQINSRF